MDNWTQENMIKENSITLYYPFLLFHFCLDHRIDGNTSNCYYSTNPSLCRDLIACERQERDSKVQTHFAERKSEAEEDKT